MVNKRDVNAQFYIKHKCVAKRIGGDRKNNIERAYKLHRLMAGSRYKIGISQRSRK